MMSLKLGFVLGTTQFAYTYSQLSSRVSFHNDLFCSSAPLNVVVAPDEGYCIKNGNFSYRIDCTINDPILGGKYIACMDQNCENCLPPRGFTNNECLSFNTRINENIGTNSNSGRFTCLRNNIMIPNPNINQFVTRWSSSFNCGSIDNNVNFTSILGRQGECQNRFIGPMSSNAFYIVDCDTGNGVLRSCIDSNCQNCPFTHHSFDNRCIENPSLACATSVDIICPSIASPTPTATATATSTSSRRPRPSNSPSSTNTATAFPSRRPRPTESSTMTSTRTARPSVSSTQTATRTARPSVSSTQTATSFPSRRPSPSNTMTATRTARPSPSSTNTASRTARPSPSNTNTASRTPRPSPSSTNTATAFPSRRPSASTTNTATATRTAAPSQAPPPTCIANVTWFESSTGRSNGCSNTVISSVLASTTDCNILEGPGNSFRGYRVTCNSNCNGGVLSVCPNDNTCTSNNCQGNNFLNNNCLNGIPGTGNRDARVICSRVIVSGGNGNIRGSAHIPIEDM